MFVAEGSDKCGELYPGVTERKEHRGQEGRQSQHHGDGEGSRKGGQGPGPCMGAGGLRGKHEHRSELGELQEEEARAWDQSGSQDRRSRGAWLHICAKGGGKSRQQPQHFSLTRF